MPGSFEGVLLIVLDFALAGGAMWAVWTLGKVDAPKRRKALAAASLSAIALFIVLCLLLMLAALVALIGMGVLLVIYYAFSQWSSEMWK